MYTVKRANTCHPRNFLLPLGVPQMRTALPWVPQAELTRSGLFVYTVMPSVLRWGLAPLALCGYTEIRPCRFSDR